jgi:hypothetical protein
MKNAWLAAVKFLEGKKTYLAALSLVLVAAGSLWTGAISPAAFASMLTIAFGMVGLGDKADRAAQMLEQFIESEKAKK